MKPTDKNISLNTQQPDEKGYFGEYGGAYYHQTLLKLCKELPTTITV